MWFFVCRGGCVDYVLFVDLYLLLFVLFTCVCTVIAYLRLLFVMWVVVVWIVFWCVVLSLGVLLCEVIVSMLLVDCFIDWVLLVV